MENKSKLFTLSWRDAFKSIIGAVCMALILFVGSMVSQPNFDVFQIDWTAFIRAIVNLSVITFFANLMQRFSTDENGKLFGKI